MSGPRGRARWLPAVVAAVVMLVAGGAVWPDVAERAAPSGAATPAGATTPPPATAGVTAGATAGARSAGRGAAGRGAGKRDDAAATALTAVVRERVHRKAVALLARRDRALHEGDRRAWLAAVDPAEPGFGRREAAAYASLRAIPFARLSHRLTGPLGSVVGRGGAVEWAGRVQVVERVRGVDPAAGSYGRPVRFVERGGVLRLADPGPVRSRAQPWELGVVGSASGTRALVVGAGGPSRLARLAAAGDAAVRAVSAVWGTRWTRRVLIYRPPTQAAMARMLGGGDPNELDQIAAVTTTVGAPRARPGRRAALVPERVVLNPRATAPLGTSALAALLRHEITHVATGSGQDEVPVWLSEGLADHIAYRGPGLPRRSVVADLLRRAASAGFPDRLPARAAFSATSTRLAEAYQGGWLAVEVLVDRYGEPAVVRAYRATQRDGLARGLREVLRSTPGAVRADWVRELRRLAGG